MNERRDVDCGEYVGRQENFEICLYFFSLPQSIYEHERDLSWTNLVFDTFPVSNNKR